jgi:hypothetical protein
MECQVCNVGLNEANVYKTDCQHNYCYDCIVCLLNKIGYKPNESCLKCKTPIERNSKVVDKVFEYNISFNKEIMTRLIEDKEFQKIYILKNINDKYKTLWKEINIYPKLFNACGGNNIVCYNKYLFEIHNTYIYGINKFADYLSGLYESDVEYL